MPPDLPLDPTSEELWGYVEAFDQAHFAGTHLQERDAWLHGFRSIASYIQTRESRSRYRWHVVREILVTLIPTSLSWTFFDPHPAAEIATVLGSVGAVIAIRNALAERVGRRERAQILDAVQRRSDLL